MNYLYKNEKLLYLSAFILLIFVSINPFSVIAQTLDPVWLSLKYNKTYLRSGPSKQNKVLWTYKQQGLPIKVKRKKGDWYEVEMPEKINGWINLSQVSKKRKILIIANENIEVRKKNHFSAKIIAKAGKNVVGDLMNCDKNFCKIDFHEIEGFVEKKFLWGVE